MVEGASVPSRFSQLDPLKDPRWPEFLRRHAGASIFHTSGWLRALQRTYDYEPTVFTSSRAGEALADGMVFCKVKSWFGKPRLVSLPFSDHVAPLVSNQDNVHALLTFLAESTEQGDWSSVELRPPYVLKGSAKLAEYGEGQAFVLHTLDLEPSLEKLFQGLNKDSTQRKILKAQRQGMKYEEGRGERQLREFFRLCVMTRRRKALPPPPFEWFRNVLRCVGENAKIRIAKTSKGELAGAIVTLHFKDVALFKYGCSDARFHKLGTMPFLLWKAIEDAKSSGARQFDFGRSEMENSGLIRFKDHFGAQRSNFLHKVYPATAWEPGADSWKLEVAKKVFARLPDRALVAAGKFLYPHIG